MNIIPWLKNPMTYIVGAVGLSLILAIQWDQANKHKLELHNKKHPPEPVAQSNPKIAVDPGILHQVDTHVLGQGTDYNTPSPAPSPTPSMAAPTPEPVEYTSLIAFDGQPVSTPSPTPVPKAKPADVWLPETNYIPCVLLGAVQSSTGGDPIILGQVTEDIYAWNYYKSKLIIPAGSRVMAYAKSGYTRDRIFAKGEWRLVYIQEGTSITFEAEACTMDFDPKINEYGLDDRSPGIKGVIIESDQYARLEAFITLLLKTGANGATSWLSSALSHGSNNNNVDIGLPDFSPLIDDSIQALVTGHHGGNTLYQDSLYVDVPTGIGFWLLTLEPVMANKRGIGSAFTNSVKPPDLLDPDAKYRQDWQSQLKQYMEPLERLNEQLPQTQRTQTDNNENNSSNAYK